MLDGLGHVRLLLDPAGTPTDRYHYDSWGNPILTGTETTRQPFRWNGAYGYEYVAFTGFYHVGAREYDPKTRRWLQRDPIDVAGGHPNVYLYCGNDPINFSDSDGVAEDPGGPKGSIRYCITAFIPEASVSDPLGNIIFKGDNRRFNPNSSCYRMQWSFTISKTEKGELQVKFATEKPQVGKTEAIKPRGYKGQAKPEARQVVMPRSDGGVDVIISMTASNPYYKEKIGLNAPPIAWRATFSFNKEGQLIRIHGFHSAYPAFEVWEYTGPRFGAGNPASCARMIYGYDPTLQKPPVDAMGLFGRVRFVVH